MTFLEKIKLIQGGMGVYVSNWRLARAVAMEKPGLTAGTVSGTALDIVYARLLQLGDPGGHIRQALAAFDKQFGVTIGNKILERFFIPGGKAPHARYKNTPTHHLRENPGDQATSSHSLTLDPDTIELLVVTSFAEVWLAKQGHSGNIFINFLNKIELPLIYSMYGAMLAGVNGIVVGAGNPDGLPAVCTSLAAHQKVNQRLSMLYRESGEEYTLSFNPAMVAGGKLTEYPLERPAFLAIVSLENLVLSLVNSQSEAPDGFIIENYTAGGHNAGPQGPLTRDEKGQPVYGVLDEPNLEVIRGTRHPFWLAGGYGSHEKYLQALTLGANGIQAGTVFALSQESGIQEKHRCAIFDYLKRGKENINMVLTTMFSPTGYPFKVAQLAGTLSEDKVYEERQRVCDIGLLQQYGLSLPSADGIRRIFQRCQAAPVDDFVGKRGLPRNTEGKRCLCNGLLAGAGFSQIRNQNGREDDEPSIVTLGNDLDGVRQLSSQGQIAYWAGDVVRNILDEMETSVKNLNPMVLLNSAS